MATLAESPQGEVWLADRVRGTSPLANAQGLLPDSEREARRLPELVAARLQFTADGALWATMSPHGGVARVTFDGTRAVRMERFDSPHGLTATSAVPIIVDREGNSGSAPISASTASARSVHTLAVGPAIPTARWCGPAMARVWLWRRPQALRPRRTLLDGSATQLQAAARQAATPIWQFDWVNLARTVAGRTTRIPLPAPFTGQPLHALLFPDDAQAWVCTGERGCCTTSTASGNANAACPNRPARHWRWMPTASCCSAMPTAGCAAWGRRASKPSTPATACRSGRSRRY
jgi:hypothetical protein